MFKGKKKDIYYEAEAQNDYMQHTEAESDVRYFCFVIWDHVSNKWPRGKPIGCSGMRNFGIYRFLLLEKEIHNLKR